MKNTFKMVGAVASVALDLAAFLLCLDSYSEIGIICAVYIAVKFLAPHCNRLSVTAIDCYSRFLQWLEHRKAMKEEKNATLEVIEAVEAEEI